MAFFRFLATTFFTAGVFWLVFHFFFYFFLLFYFLAKILLCNNVIWCTMLANVVVDYFRGVSIHWTGLLDWNTGLGYWTEIFPFLDKFMCLFVERCLHFLQSTSTWLLWMIVIITKVVYCKQMYIHTLENR